jgi:hypothetical protein
LKPKTCNNCFEVNLTKANFGNGGHYFAIITSLSHSCCALAWAQVATILIIPPLHGHGISQDVSIHFNMVLMLKTSFKS